MNLKNTCVLKRNLRIFFLLFELMYSADGAVKYSCFIKITLDYQSSVEMLSSYYTTFLLKMFLE